MRYLITLTLFLTFVTIQAQIVNPHKVRFGKISDAEIELSTYAQEPDATAVVIFDEGKLRMELDASSNTFEYLMERHIRIKILKAAGTDFANFSFFLEESDRSTAREEIVGVKGITYNLVNGRLVETKLTKDDLFEEKITDEFNRYSITFPQVKEGSLIELKYTLKSDFLFNLPTWYFQREIPTDYSSYEIVVPEYYEYNFEMKGHASHTLTESKVGEMGTAYVYYKKTEAEMVSANMKIGKSSRTNFSAAPADGNKTQKLDFNTYRSKWVAQAVPGLRQEPYAPSLLNFFFSVEFELAGTNYPESLGRSFTRNWDDIFETYQREANAKPYLDPNNSIQAMVNSLNIGGESERNKIIRIYEEIQAGFTWNNTFWIIAQQRPSQLINTKSGNSADINFLLIGALRAAGINAYPVLISTKEHGYLSMVRPSLTQFNHLIVAIPQNDGQFYFLDATQSDIPAFLLPHFDLVEKGRIIKETTTEWINITPVASKKTAIQLALTLNKSGELSGDSKLKISEYAACELRQEVADESGLLNYLSNWFNGQVSKIESTGFDDSYRDLSIQAQIDATTHLTQQNDLYYVPIVLLRQYSENLLKTEERTLPIDLTMPQEHIYIMQLKLEDGLRFEQLPENITFAMPDDKAHYSVRFIEMNGGIQVIEKLNIKEPYYSADEYIALKKFLDLAIETQQTSLVIKGE